MGSDSWIFWVSVASTVLVRRDFTLHSLILSNLVLNVLAPGNPALNNPSSSILAPSARDLAPGTIIQGAPTLAPDSRVHLLA